MSAQKLKVGNYQIGERLGEGTFGTVVKATHAIAGERVAVKVLEKKRMQQQSSEAESAHQKQAHSLARRPHRRVALLTPFALTSSPTLFRPLHAGL